MKIKPVTQHDNQCDGFAFEAIPIGKDGQISHLFFVPTKSSGEEAIPNFISLKCLQMSNTKWHVNEPDPRARAKRPLGLNFRVAF